MALEVNEVEVRFGGVQALKGVSLKVDAGQIYSVIGPNGSGKSTLFNAITGMVDAGGGDISIDGLSISGMRPEKRVRAGLARTFQTPRFDPLATVRHSIVCGFYPRFDLGLLSALVHGPKARSIERDVRRDYEEVVESLNLAHLSDELMGELPMGLVRMVEVARAVAARPKYLLLDEPAAGLSRAEQDLLVSTIRQTAASGIGVVLVEHNFQLVRNVAERVLVLNRGEMLAEGTAGWIAEHPDVLSTYFGISADEADVAGQMKR